MRKAVSVCLAVLALCHLEAQAAPLEIQVILTGEGSLYANVALVKNE